MSQFRGFAQDEHGITLVELLVVIIILGIVGAYTTTALVQGFRAQTIAQDRLDIIEEGHRSLARISREIRSACDITLSPTVADVRVGDRGAAGELDRFVIQLVGDDVEILTSTIDAGGTEGPQSRSTVATDVTDPNLFTARQSDGVTVVPIVSGVYSRDLISEVEITLDFDPPVNAIDDVRLNTSVNLRNQGTFSC